MENKCPDCGTGRTGIDSLCDNCYKEYLGTHTGSHTDDFSGEIIDIKKEIKNGK